MSELTSRSAYAWFACWAFILGVIFTFSPSDLFGPSWHYFSSVPKTGLWMGVALMLSSTLQLIALKLDFQRRWLSWLFAFSGLVLWCGGFLIGVAGIWGHHGVMEAPLMIVLGAHKFAISAGLSIKPKHKVGEHAR